MMGWYDTGSMGAGGWIAMFTIMALFWGLVIFAGVAIFRGTNSPGRYDAGPIQRTAYRDPLDILDERFARGELNDAEYESRRAILGGVKH